MPRTLQDALPGLSHGDHCCLLFQTPQEQIDITVPFLALGLERHERTVFVGPDAAIARLKEGLLGLGLDVDEARRAKRLLMTSERDYLDGGRFKTEKMLSFLQQAYEAAIAEGFTALRAAGDVSWQVGPERNFQDVVYYETLLDLFFIGKRMVGMCQYPHGDCPPETLSGVLNTHKIAAIGPHVCLNVHYVPPELLLEKNPEARQRKRVDWMTAQLLRIHDAEDARERAIDALAAEKRELERVSLERQSLQDQLVHSQKMEALGRLAGGVAHDFNNILTAIIGLARMMKSAPDDEAQRREDLDDILRCADQASALTRQLLAFSRKQVFERRPLNLNFVMKGMEKMLGRLLGEGVELVLHLDPVLAYTEADPSQLEQLLMNLVVNARDAMPGGGRLTVETANVDLDESSAGGHFGVAPGAYVQLSITDTGMGMEKATLARIFEPFFTTKAPGKGTGLGLSTAYGIVKQCGGDIWVYSEPGRGTTFKLYFPRSLEPGGSAPDAAEAPPVSLAGQETILLAEDEDSVRHLASRVLSEQGYLVLEAKDGVEALDICERYVERIHMILTDTHMPRMNGKALVERAAVLRPGIRALYMSGYSDASLSESGMLDARAEFIEKPFTPEALAKKTRFVLDKNKP